MISTNRFYKAQKVMHHKKKDGTPFTIINIADAKKTKDGRWEYTNFQLFFWKGKIGIEEGERLKFSKITGVKYEENPYNGKVYKSVKLHIDGVELENNESPQLVEDTNPFGNEMPY